MNELPHLFIVLEGFDGVGKSTTAALLAERISATLYRTPSAPYLFIRRDIDEHASFPERALFYAAAVTRASTEIERLLQNSHVVCDRYLRSTLAYHEPMWPMVRGLRNLPVLQPDLTVVLTALDSAREQRVWARDGDLAPRWCDSEEVRHRIEATLVESPCLSIDTTHLNQLEVVDVIVTELRSIGGLGADLA